MTVKELIERLQGFDGDLPVWTEGDGGYITTIAVDLAEPDGEAVVIFESFKRATAPAPCDECGGRGEVLDAPGNVLDGRAYWSPCPVCGGRKD